MPGSIPHKCNAPGCPQSTTTRYCPKHTKEANVKDSHDVLYTTWRWRKLREKFLAEHLFCECTHHACNHPAVGCLDVSTAEVDHIIPREDGGATWDWDNLQRLCKPCHSRKTQRENYTGKTVDRVV